MIRRIGIRRAHAALAILRILRREGQQILLHALLRVENDELARGIRTDALGAAHFARSRVIFLAYRVLFPALVADQRGRAVCVFQNQPATVHRVRQRGANVASFARRIESARGRRGCFGRSGM